MDTAQLIFWIIIGILSIDFVFGKIVSGLNYSWRKKTPSPALADVYDEEKYAKFQAYHRENYKMGLLSSIISFVLIMCVFFLDGFAWLDTLLRTYVESEVLLTLLFFGIIGLVSSLISMLFTIYDTFVIEQKYGFNKTTAKTFILDLIKGLILGVVIGGGLLWLILIIYHSTQEWFWLLAWIVFSVFSVFMAEFYSSIIVPLFNKQTPLEEGELRDKIAKFSSNAGFKLDNVFVINGSKRSTRANAYFTGLGKKKRIVLYDTLMNDFTSDEIVAVLAHEIGHFKKHHIRKSMMFSLLNTGIVLYIFGLFVGEDVFSQALGAEQASFHMGAIGFAILYSPLSTLTGILMNYFSRKNEREADDFAASFKQGPTLVVALKKLAKQNLSNLTPHPLSVFLNYSHPPMAERVERLMK